MVEESQDDLKAQERHYRSSRLNVLFAWSAIGLLIVTLWSIYADYSRGWKDYQRRFHAMEVAELEAKIGKSQSEVDAKRRQALEKQLETARASLKEKADRITDIDAQLSAMANDLYLADQKFRFTKALLDSAKYEYEESTRHHPDRVARTRAEMERLQALLMRADEKNKSLKAQEKSLREERRELTSSVDKVQQELKDLDKETVKLRKSLASLNRPVAEAVLNAPMLDFMNPTLKIKQIVVEGVENDINFLRIPRVDRCQTCHLGIDQAKYIGADEPFRAHRDLDLIGSSSSPHPFEKIGCTICHMGRDRGVGFVEAAHTPDSRADEARWEHEHHWHRMHHWLDPMLASRYVEAGCLQCHMRDVSIRGADKLSQGKKLFETLGCHGCHKVAGWDDLRKVGPPLDTIATKTNKEWVKYWLANPRGFRPTTKMPRFWFLSNSSSPEDIVRNNVEIQGVVEYLFEHSRKGKFSPPPSGDPARGKRLVETVGCHGCHSAIGPAGEHGDANPRSHAPNLMHVGAKTYPGWLYQWVRNPKNYWPETVMPDLRLTRAEAANVTAYLSGLRDEGWRDTYENLLSVKEEDMATVRDEMVLGNLSRDQARGVAQAKLAQLSEHQKMLLIGEKAIARYGCFGCHKIPGFEDAQPIGTELTTEGSKYVSRLDFGFEDLPHERQDWFFHKLKNPRSFDAGRVKSPEEKLRMPDFYLSDQEAESLVTLLMGLRVDEVAAGKRRAYDARSTAIEKGWRLVRTYNCTGCHLIEGQGGEVRPWIQAVKAKEGLAASEALAFAPPDLHTEGAKVQSDWLFRFLKNVTPIRPWLDIRMPTFHFTDEEVNTLTSFFAALEDATYPFEDYREGFALARGERTMADKLTSKDYLNCLSCHQVGDRKPSTPPDSWAPDLTLARYRLRADWIGRWLQDPQAIMPGTRMPTFFADENSGPPDILDGDEAAQMKLLARWVMSLGEENPHQEAALYEGPGPAPLEQSAMGEGTAGENREGGGGE